MSVPIYVSELLAVIDAGLSEIGVPADAGVTDEALHRLAHLGVSAQDARVLARFEWGSEHGTAAQRHACDALLAMINSGTRDAS